MFEEVIIVVVGFDEFCVLRYFIVGAMQFRCFGNRLKLLK